MPSLDYYSVVIDKGSAQQQQAWQSLEDGDNLGGVYVGFSLFVCVEKETPRCQMKEKKSEIDLRMKSVGLGGMGNARLLCVRYVWRVVCVVYLFGSMMMTIVPGLAIDWMGWIEMGVCQWDGMSE